MSAIFDVPLQLIMVLSLAAGSLARDPAQPRADRSADAQIARLTEPSQNREGPYRFSEQIWLRALFERSDEPRFASYARRVFRTSAGRYYAPVPAERRELMALRMNAAIAGHVAERFATANALWLSARLARAPSVAELYIAHRVGPETALQVIEAVQKHPDATLAELVPDAVEPLAAVAFENNAAASVAAVSARLAAAVDPDHRLAAARRPPPGAGGAPARIVLRRGSEDEPAAASPAASHIRLGWRTTTRATPNAAE